MEFRFILPAIEKTVQRTSATVRFRNKILGLKKIDEFDRYFIIESTIFFSISLLQGVPERMPLF